MIIKDGKKKEKEKREKTFLTLSATFSGPLPLAHLLRFYRTSQRKVVCHSQLGSPDQLLLPVQGYQGLFNFFGPALAVWA